MTERRARLPWSPGVLVLAALAYLPALTAAPGRMPTDTKLYLYLNPGRLIADAPFTWDTRQFAGWVPHQTIAYLWPSGPWFWTFEQLGVPDWVAHRLWIGTLLFAGGMGVRWAAKHLGLAASAATVAGLVYATSPYILPYISRTSVMLLPWAGVGWLVGLTVRATTRTRWRDVALFGLVVLTIGAVNAAALALVAPAPVLWLLHAAWQRSITWRRAIVVACQLGGVSLLVSMWWIVMLIVQGRHGADVLAFSETLDAVSLTSVSTETLRGLGYWLFYVRDPYAFTTTASLDYMASTKVVLVGYVLAAVCLLGIAATRWSQRRFAAMLVFCGIVLAVGVHPIEHPSPLMRPLADSALGLALRSSTRALPLSTFGLALGAGALVAAIGSVRLRWKPFAAIGISVLAVLNLPALWTGGFVDPALERDQDVPAAWSQAAASLDAGTSEARVLQLPGSEFGAFRWGYTVDPPLPGLTDKPLVTRDLLPLGSPGAMDLLYALDNRVQDGTLDLDAVAAVARQLGVDTIWLANDLAFDRFRTPRPEPFAALFTTAPAGLGTPVAYGEPTVNVPDIAMVDEQSLTEPAIGTPVAPVELVPVTDAQPVVRASSSVVVLAGSGDGVVDASAAGLLRGDEVLVYAADLAGVRDPAAVPSSAPLVVTDSNRDRAYQWRGSQDVVGYTETGGPGTDLTRTTTADERLAVFASIDEAQQTVARLDGDLRVTASEYGEPFAYRPEDRPAMAVDGDPATAWRVSDRSNPVGQSITVSSTDGTLQLLQQQRPDATRRIDTVTITADGKAPQRVDLTGASLAAPGQRVEVAAGVALTITIDAVSDVPGTDSGPSAVGFAELGPVAHEYTRVPSAPLAGLAPDRPFALVLTRLRVRPTDRWRSDPEPAMVRQFDLPVARSLDATVSLRLADRAPDEVLAALEGTSGAATADRRLTGVPSAVGASAVDGDPATSWTTPFGQALGATLTVPLAAPVPAGDLTLTQPVDGVHSPITEISITSASGTQVVPVPAADPTGVSTIAVGAISGPTVAITITGIDTRTTVDRRYAETVTLPAAISELGGLTVAPTNRVEQPTCHTGLVSVDGEPVGVQFGPDVAARLMAGDRVDVPLCTGALSLEPGTHRIATTSGLVTGVDVDRITLRSGIATTAVATDAARPTVEVSRTRTTRTATVSACPTGCWLVLGEGYNAAWDAAVDGGEHLGSPTQVSGGFNGWWLPPSDTARTVTMTWTPQRSLNIALLVAFAAVLLCLIAAVADRRRTGPVLAVAPPVPALVRPRATRRAAAVAAATLVLGAGLVVSPGWLVLCIVPAALVVVLRRPATLALAAVAVSGALGLLVTWREHRFRYFPDAAWPGHFEDLHRAGLLVVVLLLAGCLADDVDDQPSATATIDPTR